MEEVDQHGHLKRTTANPQRTGNQADDEAEQYATSDAKRIAEADPLGVRECVRRFSFTYTAMHMTWRRAEQEECRQRQDKHAEYEVEGPA